MSKLDTAINVDFAGFYNWWTRELSFLVPNWLKKLVGADPDYLVVEKDADGLRVALANGENETQLEQFSPDELDGDIRERVLEKHPKLSEAKLVLRLVPGQAIRKTIKLPMAAEENLEQVLAFDMDRVTPFKKDQVYYGAKVKSRSSADRQMMVDLVVTPKDKLDSMLDDLAATGLRPEIVDMSGSGSLGSINLLPSRYRVKPNNLLRFLKIGLAVLIVLLGAALAVLPVLSSRWEADALDEQVRKTSKTAKEVEALRQELDKLEHETSFLQDKKRTEPFMVDMLEEMSRVIPDNTWLNGLQYKDRRFVIQGQSPSASTLIEKIEESRYFRNTSFVSPVTKDTSSNLERFQIASDVVNGRFSEQPDDKEIPADQPNKH